EGRWFQLGRHTAHYVFRDDPVATRVALNANIERNVEENCMHFVLIILGQLDPVLALLRSKVGGIHIVGWTLCDQTRLEHGAKVREDEILKALLPDIIKEQSAHQVTRKRDDVVPLKPRAFT